MRARVRQELKPKDPLRSRSGKIRTSGIGLAVNDGFVIYGNSDSSSSLVMEDALDSFLVARCTSKATKRSRRKIHSFFGFLRGQSRYRAWASDQIRRLLHWQPRTLIVGKGTARIGNSFLRHWDDDGHKSKYDESYSLSAAVSGSQSCLCEQSSAAEAEAEAGSTKKHSTSMRTPASFAQYCRNSAYKFDRYARSALPGTRKPQEDS
jgi:hypothetical protein